MFTSMSKVSKRVFKVVGLMLIGIVLVGRRGYEQDFAAPGHLPELMELVKDCPHSSWKDASSNKVHSFSVTPRIIHQIWKNDHVDTYPVRASRDAWQKAMTPLNYTIKLWTDGDVLKLIQTNYAWLQSTYESYQHNIQRADLARLLVVHAEGGAYADLDVYPMSVEALHCLWRQNLRAIFVSTTGGHGLSNNFFIAERGSSFLQWALYEAKRRADTSRLIFPPYLRVFWSTGPIMVTSVFRKFSWMHDTSTDLGVLDEKYAKSVIQHAAGRSWHGVDGQVLNYFADDPSRAGLAIVLAVLFCVSVLFCVLKIRYCKFLIRRRTDL